MATNNYFGFTHGGTQYSATGAAYPAAQTGYAVAPAATAATYSTQRTGYDQAYQAAASQGTYASAGTPAVTYDYGYGRTPQTYDASKTYYQQASTTATYAAAAQPYDATQTAAKVAGYQTAQYVAAPTRNNIQQPAKTATTYANQTYVPQTTYSQTVQSNVNTAPKQAAAPTNPTGYTNYDAALYSAATMYVAAQQTNKPAAGQTNTWQGYKKSGGQHQGGNNKTRMKPQPKPQQLHYCEVCKISCAGPQTYREHLDGQKHKKREASLKLAATAASANQNRGNNLHCELCDVTCTGNDAYAAHVRGSKHQKVVKLHQKLGKPIPSADPLAKKATKINFVPENGGAKDTGAASAANTTNPANAGTATSAASGGAVTAANNVAESANDNIEMDQSIDDIKPVGLEYIEEMKDDEGKTLSFNCKLCECKFNDPNAKEMHMKGRRHRLQYKKKVQPDLVVDFKPNPRHRRLAEAKAQRAQMQAEYWNRQRSMGGTGGGGVAGDDGGDDDPMYWDERRRLEDEFDYMCWQRGGFPGQRGPHMRPPHPFFGMLPGRRPESSDDRHVVARHAEIYPKEEELQTIQRIVSHTERALKFVSDALADNKNTTASTAATTVAATPASTTNGTTGKDKTEAKGGKDAQDATPAAAEKTKEDGRDNQMFSFQKDTEGGIVRILKGVMRVGLLAKGLLLQGDNLVQLVVLCADRPTHTLLKRVVKELPIQLKVVSEEHKYSISMSPTEGAVLVTDGTITVKISLTSPLVREGQGVNQTKWYSIKRSNKDLVNERVQQIRQQNITSKIPAYPKRNNINNKTNKSEARKPIACTPELGTRKSEQPPEPQTIRCTPIVRSSSTIPPPPPPPPPSSNNNNFTWIGLLAALAAGAGAGVYFFMNNTDNGDKKTDNSKGDNLIIKKKRVPATSQEIPKEVPYLLIGGGTASFAAFRAIKSNNPKAKVMVITNETEMPYMRPPLSKELWLSGTSNDNLKFKQWNGAERSLFYEPDDFYTDPSKLPEEPNGGVCIVRGYTVDKLDVYNKTAILTDGTEIKYGECLVATGSEPKNLSIFMAASQVIKNKVSLFKNIEDFEKLKKTMEKVKSVAIIGGGFLGSELSCALSKYGEPKDLKIYQIFHEKGNMGKILPQYLSEWTTDRVREEGVNVITETQVEAVENVGPSLRLKLQNGKELMVDHVIVAVGSEPNVSLAEASDLEVDKNLGGYVVNAELEARRHVYVAGDAACFYDPKLGRRRVEHHDHAVVSGRLAGENMAGQKKPYKHQSMFWSDLGPHVGYEAIGIVDSQLPTVGVFAKSTPADTPEASSGNNLTPETEQKNEPATVVKNSSPAAEKPTADTGDNYGKGVIFYLRDDKVVGIVLWNVFNRINVARAVIAEGKKYDNLNEVAKLFEIHQ